MSKIDDLRAAVLDAAPIGLYRQWLKFEATLDDLILGVREETLAELGDNDHVRNGDTCPCDVHRAWAEVEG